jgi:hypothetical protein
MEIYILRWKSRRHLRDPSGQVENRFAFDDVDEVINDRGGICWIRNRTQVLIMGRYAGLCCTNPSLEPGQGVQYTISKRHVHHPSKDPLYLLSKSCVSFSSSFLIHHPSVKSSYLQSILDARKRLFLILPTHNRDFTVLQFLFQKFVYREGHRLAWCNTHDSRGYAFVESMETFLSMKNSH